MPIRLRITQPIDLLKLDLLAVLEPISMIRFEVRKRASTGLTVFHAPLIYLR
ncbi:hypothetical protein D3C80_2143390 [compost metagenome]